MEIAPIIKGHLNEIFGLGKTLKEARLQICYSCPLYSDKLGGICNSKIWLNPNTGDISMNEKQGYIKGCGCRLLSKTTLPNAKCPANKW